MATNIDFRQQVTELMLLQRIALKIGSLLDLEILLEEIVGDVAQTFGYSRSAVLLKDAEANELVIAAVRGWTANVHRKGERFRIGEYGIVGHVGQNGKMLLAFRATLIAPRVPLILCCKMFINSLRAPRWQMTRRSF